MKVGKLPWCWINGLPLNLMAWKHFWVFVFHFFPCLVCFQALAEPTFSLAVTPRSHSWILIVNSELIWDCITWFHEVLLYPLQLNFNFCLCITCINNKKSIFILLSSPKSPMTDTVYQCPSVLRQVKMYQSLRVSCTSQSGLKWFWETVFQGWPVKQKFLIKSK